MTKEEARREAIRRWRAQPIMSRQTHKQALAFAEVLAPLLAFHTVANVQRVIEAWLIRDIEDREAATLVVDAARRNPS